jgi:glycosyltransferase involved in cell wall biosynthesis
VLNETVTNRPIMSLVVVRDLPWPDSGGGRMRNLHNITILSTYGRVMVLAAHEIRCLSPSPPSHLVGNIDTWTSLDQLLLEDPPPYEYYPEPLKLEWWENPLGHPSDITWSPFRHVALERYIERHKIDFVLFEDICLWRYVEAVDLNVPVLMDCHNSQSHLDRESAAAHALGVSAVSQRILHAASYMETIHRELPVAGFVVCSANDQERLVEIGVDSSRIDIVHNVVQPLSKCASANNEKAWVVSELLQSCPRPIILFAGIMNYAPNVDAALFLIEHVLPLVRLSIPDAHLLIVGKWPTPDLIEAAFANRNVLITGEVLNTLPYYSLADVLCVPLRYGGGTRFKILEAFAAGLPVVSSAKGCEGLAVTNGRELLIAETAQENADALGRILSDKVLTHSLCSSARTLLESAYTPVVAAKQLDDILFKYGVTSDPRSGTRIE